MSLTVLLIVCPESGDDGGKILKASALPAIWREKSPSPSDNEGLLGSASTAGEEQEEEEVGRVERGSVCGLLEVSVVLWEEVEDRLKKKTHSKLRQRLVSRTEKNLPLFWEALTVGRRFVCVYVCVISCNRQGGSKLRIKILCEYNSSSSSSSSCSIINSTNSMSNSLG